MTFVGSSSALDFQPNLLPGLVPPPGTVWRGATIPFDALVEDRVLEASWEEGANPQVFEDYYGQPLHIYRSFNNHWNAPLVDDAEWVSEGGIVFYSIQLKDWAEYANGSRDDEIRLYARAIAEHKPHQFMVPVGYEPDLYAEHPTNPPEKIRGTTEDYKNMIR